MIIDSSAILAIAYREPEARRFVEIISDSDGARLSAGGWLELAAVLTRSGEHGLRTAVDEMITALHIVIEPVTVEQAEIARDGYARYGRGAQHRANLNFGDCFAYALAKATGDTLLFKGDDFGHTDITAAA